MKYSQQIFYCLCLDQIDRVCEQIQYFSPLQKNYISLGISPFSIDSANLSRFGIIIPSFSSLTVVSLNIHVASGKRAVNLMLITFFFSFSSFFFKRFSISEIAFLVSTFGLLFYEEQHSKATMVNHLRHCYYHCYFHPLKFRDVFLRFQLVNPT